jgi:hypothetical protein
MIVTTSSIARRAGEGLQRQIHQCGSRPLRVLIAGLDHHIRIAYRDRFTPQRPPA